MRPSLPQAIARSGLRALVVLGFAALWTATIWICVVAGIILALRPVLGTAGALLSVGGGLTILGLVAGVAAFRTKKQPPRTLIQDDAIAAALTTLQARGGRRLALGSLGALLLVAAAFMPTQTTQQALSKTSEPAGARRPTDPA